MPPPNTMLANYKIRDEDWPKFVSTSKAKAKFARCLKNLSAEIYLDGSRGFDFGCGEGTFTRILQAAGAVMAGCDVAQNLIEQAGDAALVHGGVGVLESVEAGSLDFIVAMQVLDLMPAAERERFWLAARAALRLGGALLILSANSHMAPERKASFTPELMDGMLADRGFAEVRQDFYNCLWPWTSAPLRRLAQSLGRAPWVFDAEDVDAMPLAHRCRRCTAMISVSRRALITSRTASRRSCCGPGSGAWSPWSTHRCGSA